MRKKFLLIFILFIFSCAPNNEIIKYKNFYNFESFLKLKALIFQPFPPNIAFKAKIKLIVNRKKFTFYSVVYSYRNYCRIFSYALFGKKISDILFLRDKIFIVLGRNKIIYISDLNKENISKSLFNFLKDVIKGIYIKNAFVEKDCYKGFYYNFLASACRYDSFKKLVLTFENIKRVVKVLKVKNNKPKEILIDFGKEKLLVNVKEFFYPQKSPEKSFLSSIKNYKRYYVRNLIKLEKIMFMENKNENK